MELFPWNFMENFPLNSMQQLHGAISMEFHVLKLTPWNSIEFHGFPWKIFMEFHGISWGYFTIFKVVVLTWVLLYMYMLACEQALLGVGGGREKEERACHDVSGVFISALNFSRQNADWWILSLVLTSLLFACVVLTTQKWWRSFYL